MGVTQSYTLFVAHATKPEAELAYSYLSSAGQRNYSTRWNLDTVRRMTKRIYADMGWEWIDACRIAGNDVPQYAKPYWPVFVRVMQNCMKLSRTLLPQGLRDELFRDRDNCKLTLIVPLSLYFIPWELLSDGDMFLAERFSILKLVQ